jgi:hypothetical protein
MQGFLDVILEGEGVIGVVGPTLVLMVFGAVFATIAAVRFRFEETKIYYG